MHPVCALLASGVARPGPLSVCLAGVLAFSSSWNHGGRALRVAPGVVVSSGPVAWVEESAQPCHERLVGAALPVRSKDTLQGKSGSCKNRPKQYGLAGFINGRWNRTPHARRSSK